MDNDKYFATLPPDEIGAEIFKRVDQYYEYIRASGRLVLYRRSFDAFYQAYRSGGRVYATGPSGEFKNIDLADYRNILLHLKVLTTSQRPAYEPKATNSDHKSATQTMLASGLLEYYLRDRKLERNQDMAVEHCLRYGDAYVELDWNATAGEEYQVDDSGKVAREGELEAWNYTPLDVTQDFTRPTALNHDWYVTRRWENKWNVVAKYAPDENKHADLRDAIMSCAIREVDRDFMFGVHQYGWRASELIPVYTLHHRRCEACPEGRFTRLVSDRGILLDGPLPYKNLTIYRISPGVQDGTPFGYSVGFDLLPLQQAINALISTVATNQSTFGVQNIAAQKGSGVQIQQILDGLNLIEFDGQTPPTALNLVQTPAEIFKFIDMLRSMMEVIAGINSVSRGDPAASLKSGAALALVQSMAVQFNSALQQSYAQLSEDIGTGIIEILQDFAKTKRVATIAGKSQRALLKEWTGDDIDRIRRVTVDLGNPLSRTTAGRVNMAEQLMQAGMVENPAQYLQVLSTGRIEPLIENKQAELLNIRSENERLADGKPVMAVVTDNHVVHINEHKVVIASPEAREDPNVVNIVTEHLMEHIRLLRESDPVLLQLLGQQPIPPEAQPPGAGGGGPGGAPGAGMAPGGTGTGAPPPEGLASTLENGEPAQASPALRMPKQPTNPLSGQEFNPDTGGLV